MERDFLPVSRPRKRAVCRKQVAVKPVGQLTSYRLPQAAGGKQYWKDRKGNLFVRMPDGTLRFVRPFARVERDKGAKKLVP